MGRRTSTEPVRAYVSLGSNIRPELNLPRAVELLAERLELERVSSLYASEAKGQPDSPPFLNAAVALVTGLTPRQLKFEVLRRLEREMGRVRTDDPNAPRVIDLDLSLYGDLVASLEEDGLELPDPDLASAAHVILPLAEIAGDVRHPVTAVRLRELAAPFGDSGGIRVVGELELPGRGER